MKLTKEECEWIQSCLPVTSDQFRPELLLERRPKLGKILEEMSSTWARFCELYDEMDETARRAFCEFPQEEREHFVDWELIRICGEDLVGFEEKMREQLSVKTAP